MFRSDISLGNLISVLFDEYLPLMDYDEDRASVAVAHTINHLFATEAKGDSEQSDPTAN